MGKKLEKFFLLLWKNWKLQYRRPLQTAVEITAPIIFSALLVILRSLVDPEIIPSTSFPPFSPVLTTMSQDQIDPRPKSLEAATSFLKKYSLVYSPTSNKILDRCMHLLEYSFKSVKGYENSKQIETHFFSEDFRNTFAVIQYNDDLRSKTYLPSDIQVSLRFPSELRSINNKLFTKTAKPVNESKENVVGSRLILNLTNRIFDGLILDKLKRIFLIKDWKTNLLYPVFAAPGPREPESHTGATPSYSSEGFLALQVLVTSVLLFGQLDGSISKLKSAHRQNQIPILHMQRFPHASWKQDPLLPALISFMGILIMLSFVYTCINTVKVITIEKEKQLKEAMKIMGLPNWLHWTAWFVKSSTFLLISVTFITVLLTTPWYHHTSHSVLTHANPIILFLFLLLYVCASITFCFSISAFFSKANTAAAVAGLLWFLSYAPYLFLQTQYDQLDLSVKLLVSLGSNTAMAYGFQIFLMYECTSDGIQWDNIWKPNTPDDSLSLGLIMVMLVIDAFIYLCLTLYVEAIFPGEYGIPLPWYFPLTLAYWHSRPKNLSVTEDDYIEDGEYMEEPIQNSKPGIRIIKLRKVFGKRVVVNNLSLDLYDGQITVLLGHNGAGKTTTMSMLTGMIPATSGTAIIGGFDIRKNMKKIRSSLGLCPQHNVLFDDLTVHEHLYFFSKLKEIDKTEIKKEIDKYVQLLDLQQKVHQKSSSLSGGMKRRLCVGIALCGGSKVILLDEPTTGIDPTSRRALWDLLQAQKKGRCVLLTTHYMDEADLLGDRIAIMANGELKCCGSSFFLKKTFGTGYHLILEKSPNCKVNEITKLLQNYVPNIQIRSNIGSELTYFLAENHASLFEEMIRDLERNRSNLGIQNYGISFTSLEDVFMKVSAKTEYESKNIEITEGKYKRKIDISLDSKSIPKKIVLLSGSKLIRNQFLAMFIKKSLSIIRSWLLQIITLLIPVTFLIIAIVVSRNLGKNKLENLPKLPIKLKTYQNTVILVEDNANNNYSKYYFETVKDYKVKRVSNITETILNLTKTVPKTVDSRYLIGASFNQTGQNGSILKAWFNNNPYHTPPLALALVLNAVYKSILGNNHSITFTNYPLPFTADQKIERLLKGKNMGFQLAFNVGFSLAFVSSFYVLFYVKERVSKSKHLQFTSGVKSYIFWTTSYICDLLTFIVTSLCVLITLVCFQEEGFKTFEQLGRVFCLLFSFGFAMLPMMYIASYFFHIPSTGYTRMTLFSILTGVTAFLVVQILSTPGLDLKYVAEGLHWLFLLFPHYSLATGIRDNYIIFVTENMCNVVVKECLERELKISEDDCRNMTCHNNFSKSLANYCCVREHDYFQWKSPGIGRNLLYSYLIGSILFILLNISEYGYFSNIKCLIYHNQNAKTHETILDEDNDVSEEKQKIRDKSESQLIKSYALVFKDVTKFYKKVLAVDNICFGVKQFECFGLLGVNGAGKTTAFKMITGESKITYGNVWIHGFSVKTHLKNIHEIMGYCPQFDALLTDLTAQETLIIFALIRGVPCGDCQYVAEKLAMDLDFYRHFKKKVRELSGGNKRKLSTAVSLMGDPPIVCLDEPTSGMDPVTKRNFWNAICTIRNSGKCVLLTSHSMEECEALCTRLAIMVNGNFKCLGSVQHLKTKFAGGFTLTIKLKRFSDAERESAFGKTQKFIFDNFPTAILRQKHQGLITYYITDQKITWSKMFGILEKAKNSLNIDDYSLGQATLEEIFLTLTSLNVHRCD